MTRSTAVHLTAIAAVALALFALAFGSRNNDYLSDPRFNLVTAQAILDYGSIALDPYQEDGIQGFDFDWYLSRGEMVHINGHYYDYFPVGTGVLSVPAVWLATSLGMDMRTSDNAAVQRILSAATVSLVFALLYVLARSQLDAWPSLVLSTIFAAGSSTLSTMGSALWSVNYAAILVAGTLCLLAYHTNKDIPWYLGVTIGALLFLAYLCRPSTSTFILTVLLYLFLRHRPAVAVVATTAAILLLIFALWSKSTYGLWLPPYYVPARLSTGALAPLQVGLLGHLASPSRGLLVFSPYLLLLLVATVLWPRVVLRESLSRACVLWSALVLVTSSQGVAWWGGWSFGPRLLTEMVPGLLFVTAAAWRALRPQMSRAVQRVFVLSFVALGGLAAIVHGAQGLYNPSVARWNALVYPLPPASSDTMGDLFNWSYSQAFASDAVNCRIEHDHGAFLLPLDRTLSHYVWGTPITYAADLEADWRSIARNAPATPASDAASPALPGDYRVLLPLVANRASWQHVSNSALFVGFQVLNPSHRQFLSTRWTLCSESQVIIGPVQDPTSHQAIVLDMSLRSTRAQRVLVYVNGTAVGEGVVDSQPGDAEPVRLTFKVPVTILSSAERNTITIRLPWQPDDNWLADILDPTIPYGIELHEMKLYPAPT